MAYDKHGEKGHHRHCHGLFELTEKRVLEVKLGP